jgi:hypothetical protein
LVYCEAEIRCFFQRLPARVQRLCVGQMVTSSEFMLVKREMAELEGDDGRAGGRCLG